MSQHSNVGDLQVTHHETRVIAMVILAVCMQEAQKIGDSDHVLIYQDLLRELRAIDGSW